MNCKPGDLAMYVGIDQADAGKVVRVVGPFTSTSWVVEPPLSPFRGHSGRNVKDAALRPIRDSDGEDETLTWAGRPLEKAADDVAELHRQVDRLADIARPLAAVQKLL
jgi:hypothetical protein